MAAMKNAKSPELYYAYLLHSAAVQRSEAACSALWTLPSRPDVRSQDALQLVTNVLGNPAGEQLAWDFIRQHWRELEKAADPSPALKSSELPAYSATQDCAIR